MGQRLAMVGEDKASRRDLLAQMAMAGVTALSWPAAAAAPRAHRTAQTVLGRLDVSKLGVTLPHEHIADAPDVLRRWPKDWGGRPEFVDRAVDALKRARAAGVGTIVDLTTYDVGRDIRFLREVSRKSGLHMIASTGQRFFPPNAPGVTMPDRTIAGLAGFFTREIQHGIDGTDIKAGVIKIGIIAGTPTPLEETGLRAAARTSKATGVPIRTHTDARHRAGESHAVILESEGIDPASVSFDHSDDSGDVDYFLGLAKRGYCLGMDHVHRGTDPNVQPSFEKRAQCIKALADAGFAGKVFLSQDVEFGGTLLPEQAREWRETIDPAEGLLFTSRKLAAHLARIGVSARDIHTMTVDNPRNFFAVA